MEPVDQEPDLPPASDPGEDIDEDAAEASARLSPSVRRLAKQYAIDVTGIQGSGPGGRIRVGDVMAVLGNRASPSPSEAALLEAPKRKHQTGSPARPTEQSSEALSAPPLTSVFECDMTAVLRHRKQMLSRKEELLLTSYYLSACARALQVVPEANPGVGLHIGVALSGADGRTVTPVVRHTELLDLGRINDALRLVHGRLRSGELTEEEQSGATFLLFHHGLTGSLLATPTPLGKQHAASLGIGKIRRQLAVQNVSGEKGPRVAPSCYVSLSFNPGMLDFHLANRLLSQFVATLERWPQASP